MSAYTHHGECSTSDPCKRCFEFGETTERERIIKLLDKDYWHSQLWNFAEVICLADCEMCKTIALIKGEYLEDEQTAALKMEIAELQNDLDRFGAEMDICTCELIEAEIERLTEQLKGDK